MGTIIYLLSNKIIKSRINKCRLKTINQRIQIEYLHDKKTLQDIANDTQCYHLSENKIP